MSNKKDAPVAVTRTRSLRSDNIFAALVILYVGQKKMGIIWK